MPFDKLGMGDRREIERRKLADRRQLPITLDGAFALVGRPPSAGSTAFASSYAARSPGESMIVSGGRVSQCCIAVRTAAGVIAA